MRPERRRRRENKPAKHDIEEPDADIRKAARERRRPHDLCQRAHELVVVFELVALDAND